MSFSINVLDWCALAPRLTNKEEWFEWVNQQEQAINDHTPLPKCPQLPMMMARRLNSGSRLAVNCGLEMYQAYPNIDAIVFSSRHGELERNYRILSELATQTPISPTNFTMSVHNSAVGSLAIIAKSTIATSSVSAGVDSFQQGLYEVLSLLQTGCGCVLYIDFDGYIPEVYHSKLPANSIFPPYACAFILTKGTDLHCTPESIKKTTLINNVLPQSLQFLRGLLKKEAFFSVSGETHLWHWQIS